MGAFVARTGLGLVLASVLSSFFWWWAVGLLLFGGMLIAWALVAARQA